MIHPGSAMSDLYLRRWLCAAALITAAAVSGQRVPSLQGLVRTAGDKQPLAGAEVVFQPGEQHQVMLLQGWTPVGAPRKTRTTEQGHYKIAGVQAHGCLLVTHARGQGALVHRTGPGASLSILARPMGELVLPDGSESSYLMAVSPEGRTSFLGPRKGNRLRLPQGRYRLLVKSTQWQEFSCRVVSGKSLRLTPDPRPPRQLTIYDGFRGRVTLKGWPYVAIPHRDGTVLVPGGPGPRILQVWELHQGTVLQQEIWCTNRRQALARSQPKLEGIEVQDDTGHAVGGAWCFSIATTAGGLRVVSSCQSDERGLGKIADQRRNPTGFVLVLKPGFCLGHRETHRSADPLTVRLAPSQRLHLWVIGPRGQPQAEVEVRLSWPDMPWATRTATTNAMGDVLFTGLPLGKAEARLVGTPFLATAQPVSIAAGGGRKELQARRGFVISGQVLMPGGKQAADGALVTVRDPSGRHGLQPRTARSDPQGRFLLQGLPEAALLLVSARLEADGRTLSSRETRTETGTKDLTVELIDEEVAPPTTRKATGKAVSKKKGEG